MCVSEMQRSEKMNIPGFIQLVPCTFLAVNRDITVQRDYVASSQEGDSPVDLDLVLSFAFAPVPLLLASADGVKRKTNKSKLYDIFDSCMSESNTLSI